MSEIREQYLQNEEAGDSCRLEFIEIVPLTAEILMVRVQQTVTVEIGLLKSNKKTCQL